MKIYSATDSWYTPYVGKDAWVLCKQPWGAVKGHWVRLMSRTSIQGIFALAIVNHSTSFFDPVDIFTYRGTASYWSPVTPIQVKTTQELFGRSESSIFSNDQFDKFIGKNIWIKVRDSNGWENYIKIQNKIADILYFSEAPADIIDDPTLCAETGEDDGRPSEYLLRYSCQCPAGLYTLITPVDAYTDDDIQEALALCDKYWEERPDPYDEDDNEDVEEEYEDEEDEEE